MNYLTYMKSPGKGGFIMMPRLLLENVFAESGDRPYTPAEAYMFLLYSARYADEDGVRADLHRGELFFSLRDLGQKLKWSKDRTMAFLQMLEQDGVAAVRRTGNRSCLTLLHYDRLCRMAAPARTAEEKRLTRTEESFERFWQEYHELSQKPALERHSALSAWRKLNLYEREEALRNIEPYLFSLENMAYARTAANYLQKKSFIID